MGWGSGVTVHASGLLPEVKSIVLMEIEGAVVQASPFFRPFNGAALRDPRVRVIYDDARGALLARPARYDVLISEPSNPWMAGVSALFIRDFTRWWRGA